MTPSDQEHEYTLRAPRYAVLQSVQECWKCHGQTPVIAFLVPAGHETLWIDDDPGLDEWEGQDSASIVSNISRLSAEPLARAHLLSSHYDLGTTKMGGSYFLNTCAHCCATQGDFFLHSEPGGAFFPTTQAGIDNIHILPVNEPFSCHGDSSYGSVSDDLGARAW